MPKQQKAPRKWPRLVAIGLLAALLVLPLQAVVILFRNQECVRGSLQLTDLPQAKACMRQNLSDPAQWLDWWAVGIVVIVCLGLALALWNAHWWSRAHRMAGTELVGDPHLHVIVSLAMLIGLTLFVGLMVYTNGFSTSPQR